MDAPPQLSSRVTVAYAIGGGTCAIPSGERRKVPPSPTVTMQLEDEEEGEVAVYSHAKSRVRTRTEQEEEEEDEDDEETDATDSAMCRRLERSGSHRTSRREEPEEGVSKTISCFSNQW